VAASEGKQVLDHLGGPLGFVMHQLRVAVGRLRQIDIHQQLRKPANYG
jgi:hypothetical protein